MKPIPLIDAEHVARIASQLDANGIPAERYLGRAHISPAVRESSVGFLPGRCVWSLAHEVDRGEMLADFWLDIARVSHWRRAGWVLPMTHSATLLDAIRAMCASYPRQIPMNQLGLEIDGPVAWFWRRRVPDVHDWPGSEPAEQYTLSFMLEVVRAAAGAEWLPAELQVECAAAGWPAATSRLAGVRLRYERPVLAVSVPVPLLSLPVSISALPPCGAQGEPPATDFHGSLRQVLKPSIGGDLPGQEETATLLGLSPRTLRRRLAEEGTGWHAVVNDLKFSHAVERLQEGRCPVREIAEELGYADTAHFTRFFRLRSGVAPSRYFEEIERARALVRIQRP